MIENSYVFYLIVESVSLIKLTKLLMTQFTCRPSPRLKIYSKSFPNSKDITRTTNIMDSYIIYEL